MMFPIFEWEIRAVELAKSLPHAGPLYWFMSFLSDFSQSKWLVFLAAGFWIWQNGWRSVFNTMISVVIAVGISDIFSRRVVKPMVSRPRPGYVGQTCDFKDCWGFASSHSANVAAAVLTISRRHRRSQWLFAIVILVGLSRIYLADHFPLDVLGGFAIGVAIALALEQRKSRFDAQSEQDFSGR